MLSRLALLLVLPLLVQIESYAEAAFHDRDFSDARDPGSLLSLRLAGVPFFPVLAFQVEDKTANNSRFKREIGSDYALRILKTANENTAAILGPKSVRKVYGVMKLTVESIRGRQESPVVSIVTGKHIRLDSDYLETFPGDVKFEFSGILLYDCASIWEWTGSDTAPIWLLSGIADYVRLKAGWPSATWPMRGSGTGATDGYEVTAYFLEYCSITRSGFVAELNSMMKESYSNNYFTKLLGKSIAELWGEYKKAYGKGVPPAAASRGKGQ
ncbi:hypothetical protein MLD38_013711 [Melastoma candidum]|uniref:Uncharacterized protein n=1 Tax=Melastoma candidum TaxID=119954 RepID=A0ACB9RAJ3_9MYRT|nr:hypothetical protein MLD38_013711 [Melastoma candidum]